jgi:hypothetical protein
MDWRENRTARGTDMRERKIKKHGSVTKNDNDDDDEMQQRAPQNTGCIHSTSNVRREERCGGARARARERERERVREKERRREQEGVRE